MAILWPFCGHTAAQTRRLRRVFPVRDAGCEEKDEKREPKKVEEEKGGDGDNLISDKLAAENV